MEKRNIILVGPMGSGKSTVGPVLACMLGWSFLDTDRIIVDKAGMEITEIFEKKGESYFRILEKEVLTEALNGEDKVISTGGGAVTDKENLNLMKEKGFIVYLKASVSELTDRLLGVEDRPLLAGENIKDVLKRLLDDRERYYQQADLVLMTDGLSVLETAEKIIRTLDD